MTQNTTYLITGANRGIGLALTTTLLFRPSTTVIATIRHALTPTTSLLSLPLGQNSNLIILPLDFSTSFDSQETLTAFVQTLTNLHGIKAIDTVIANAGTGTSFAAARDTGIDDLRENWEVNALGPVLLFQALYPLLSTSFPSSETESTEGEGGEGNGGNGGMEKKFILISSSLGSIEAMEGGVPSLAYGMSKAAANYLVRKVHFEEGGIVAIAVHPGWVKTANGQAFADSIGVSAPPMSVEDSARGVLEQIDRATKDTTSGSFLSYDGTVIPW